jgi:hypothetical protein
MQYQPLKIPPTLETPYSEMRKAGARTFFEWLNHNAEYRIGELQRLAGSRAGAVLDYSPESLLPLGRFLQAQLAIRSKADADMSAMVERAPDWLKTSVTSQNIELTEMSLSIAFDVAIYFSKVLMAADDRIKWRMFTTRSKLDADRNQLVLVGTSKWQFNPIRSMDVLCFQIATGKEKDDALFKFFHVVMGNLVA